MKIITTPERLVLSALYSGDKKSFDQIVIFTELAVIDCFNILQRLIIKNLIKYCHSFYFLDQKNIKEVRDLLQVKQQLHLEAEQIVRSTIELNEDKMKLKEIQCTSYDLKILRHYFNEIEHFLLKISKNKTEGRKKHYVFWGEQSTDSYLNQIKKNYQKA